MARKTHAIGFRLGEGSWWETRTPPRIGREGTQGVVKRVIKGMMEKYGYIITEPMIKEKGNGESVITIVGGRGPIGLKREGLESRGKGIQVNPQKGEENKKELTQGGTLEKYVISYLNEWIKKYTKNTSEVVPPHPKDGDGPLPSKGWGRGLGKVDLIYRESENWNSNAEQIFKHIVRNERLILTTMRRIKRMGEARALISPNTRTT